jgi:crotonobetainyl-CoA:carnitine CoA-transferase CaiB-like acyl-CoA transferase
MSFDSVQSIEDLLADQGGVQCGRVRTWKEMLGDNHTKERGLIAQVEDPVLGNVSVMNSPFRTATSNIGIRGPAPLIGQHSTEVFQDMLGYSNEQLLDLVNQNALFADESIMPTLIENLIGTD